MKKYKAECSICKRTFEHDKELVTKQMLGFHKRKEHGIHGVTASNESRRIAARERHWRIKGYSPAKIEAMRAKHAAKESPTHPADEPVRKPKKATDAVPLALTECPLCRARFYYTVEQKGQ